MFREQTLYHLIANFSDLKTRYNVLKYLAHRKRYLLFFQYENGKKIE